MSEYSLSSEVFGSKALTFATVIGSALLLMAILAAPAPQATAQNTVQQPAAQPAATVSLADRTP